MIITSFDLNDIFKLLLSTRIFEFKSLALKIIASLNKHIVCIILRLTLCLDRKTLIILQQFWHKIISPDSADIQIVIYPSKKDKIEFRKVSKEIVIKIKVAKISNFMEDFSKIYCAMIGLLKIAVLLINFAFIISYSVQDVNEVTNCKESEEGRKIDAQYSHHNQTNPIFLMKK